MAKPRQVKCKWCNELGNKEEMECVESGKKTIMRKYYHTLNCYSAYVKDKKFKQKEAEELTELSEVIKKVHQIDVIPKSFYPFLQDLRNDSTLFGKMMKKYKEGITYKTITNTYLYCEDSIRWAKANKQFKNIMAELKYCLAIIRNNVENSKKQRAKTEKTRIEREQLIKHTSMMQKVNTKLKEKMNIPHEATNSSSSDVDLTTLFD